MGHGLYGESTNSSSGKSAFVRKRGRLCNCSWFQMGIAKKPHTCDIVYASQIPSIVRTVTLPTLISDVHGMVLLAHSGRFHQEAHHHLMYTCTIHCI